MKQPSPRPSARFGWLGSTSAGANIAACCTTVATPAYAGRTLPQPSTGAQLHAEAASYFRQGRYSEAYGRFVALADAGHSPLARIALWMCEHGLMLFGRDWDCAPYQVERWAAVAGVAVPRIGSPDYGASGPAREADPSPGALR
jgi:hypothetical protein